MKGIGINHHKCIKCLLCTDTFPRHFKEMEDGKIYICKDCWDIDKDRLVDLMLHCGGGLYVCG